MTEQHVTYVNDEGILLVRMEESEGYDGWLAYDESEVLVGLPDHDGRPCLERHEWFDMSAQDLPDGLYERMEDILSISVCTARKEG